MLRSISGFWKRSQKLGIDEVDERVWLTFAQFKALLYCTLYQLQLESKHDCLQLTSTFKTKTQQGGFGDSEMSEIQYPAIKRTPNC